MSKYRKYSGCGYQEIVEDTPLFDETKPAHHLSDPPASLENERIMTKSGKRQSQCKLVYDCLVYYGAMTSGEIAQKIGLTYHQVQKRVFDLEYIKKVVIAGERKCKIRGTKCTVWRIIQWPK